MAMGQARSEGTSLTGEGLFFGAWCLAVLATPFLLDRGSVHPELLQRVVSVLLGTSLFAAALFCPRTQTHPSGWALLVLLVLVASPSIWDVTGSLDPALIWAIGIWLGFRALAVRPRLASQIWVLSAGIVAVVSIVRFAESSLAGSGYLYAMPFGNSNLAGVMLASAIPQVLTREGSRSGRVWLAGLLGLGLVCTKSLGAAACLGAVLLWAGAMGSHRRALHWLILGAAILVPWCLAWIGPGLDRGTFGIRRCIWRGAYVAFKDSPLVGWGPGSFASVFPSSRPPEYFLNPLATPGTTQGHCEALERAAEGGLLGLTPFLAFLFLWIRKVPADPVRRSFQASGLIFACHGMVDITLRTPGTCLLFGMALGASWEAAGRPRPVLRGLGFAALLLLSFQDLHRTHALSQAGRALHASREAAKVGNLSLALRELDLGLVPVPRNIEILYERGFLLGRTGRISEAEASYRRVACLSPDYAEVRANLASILLQRGMELQALPHLQAGLRSNPYDADSLWNLALISYRLGELESCSEALERILERSPRDTRALRLKRELGVYRRGEMEENSIFPLPGKGM